MANATTTATPYGSAAHAYRAAGWDPLPLPPGLKWPPPSGYTGYNGKRPADEQIDTWAREQPNSNIALRLPDGMVGIDVDDYSKTNSDGEIEIKRGGETLRRALNAWGPLPPAWRSTSRVHDPVSGIRYYKVPLGTVLPGKVGLPDEDGGDPTSDIEIVQQHHRYAVVGPSVHPDGRPYEWQRPDGSWREAGSALPRREDCYDLPQPWLNGLVNAGVDDQGRPKRPGKPKAHANGHAPRVDLPEGEPCQRMLQERSKGLDECQGGSRHDSMLARVLSVVRLGERLHPGAPAVLADLRDAFVEAVKPDRTHGAQEAEQEFNRMVVGALAMVAAEPTDPQWRGCSCAQEAAGGSQTAQDWVPVDEQPATSSPMPEPPAAIFHGLPGRLSKLATEYVESDQASILVQLLTAFGVAVGIRPVFMVGATRHVPAVFTGLVGRTSRARKGTGGDVVEEYIRRADPTFSERIKSGLGSGEKLIHLVRDPENGVNGMNLSGSDRRLLLREPELARLLVVVNREGSTLSHYLREAFDGKPLSNAVKNDGATATTHRIGLIGHTTPDELRGSLNARQVRNGLANRIGWFLAKRERLLSRPPVFEGQDVDDAGRELQEALQAAKGVLQMDRDKAAWALWDDWYTSLPDEENGGLVAAITDRAEALVTRWSLIYALMDRSAVIESSHLEAAFSLYEYERACVEWIWGRTTGDPLADRVLADLAYGPMFQSEIVRDTFDGHISAQTLLRVGHDLEEAGLIRRVPVKPAKGSAGGRPPVRWEWVR